jgi:hypothetical protein
MAGIPNSRLGRAIKAGIPIALVIAGAALLEGRLTIQRENGQITLTAAPIERHAQVVAADVVRSIKSCISPEEQRHQSRWSAVITLPVNSALSSIRRAMDIVAAIGSSSNLHRVTAFLGVIH